MRRFQYVVLSLIIIALPFVGGFIEHSFDMATYNVVIPRQLTRDLLERTDLNASIPPIDILVRIEPMPKIKSLCGATAYACTTWWHTPCTVHFPAGERVSFNPQTELASWQNPTDGSILAHEFLHCLYPNWHQPFTDKLTLVSEQQQMTKPSPAHKP